MMNRKKQGDDNTKKKRGNLKIDGTLVEKCKIFRGMGNKQSRLE